MKAFCLALLWMVGSLSMAQAGVVSTINADVHMGVASCASSVCHGASQPFKDSNVWQSEFARWQEFDPHATKAYQALLGREGQAIARKLGLGDASKAKICLDCHTDNPPEDKRGERFQLTDGVGCEACHGGSERWLSSHTGKDTPHADNLANGLYPTEDPVKRAELCLSCHMGTADRMITHRIMGAGHPRLGFELDTFTWLPETVHYEIDDDYVQRKGEFNGVRDWGIGQGIAAVTLLETLLDPRHGWDGIFPELVLFDCHACHKRMDSGSWAARPGTGLGPGVVRLNDANLVMFRHVLAAVDRGAAQRIGERIRALHRATTENRDATAAAARTLIADIRALLPRVAETQFGSDSLGPILDSLLADAERGEYRDYAAAEQAAMAASSVITAFEALNAIEAERGEVLRARIDTLYSKVDDENAYSMDGFVAALRELRRSAD
ncbi:MAG: multiheme c-type cytochrome [Lysobacteraceae bacterium]